MIYRIKWNKFKRLGAKKGSFDQRVADRFDMNDDACRRVIVFYMPGFMNQKTSARFKT